MIRVLDLFSGIGGFSLGLERTGGFETVAFCEIEEFPRKVLKKHWPEVPQYHDVRELTADVLRRDGIGVDVICGGFPCQDISTAGNGAGLEGERSGLWFEYARLIRELRPQFVIVENVAALLHRGLERVLGSLAEIGYDAEWHCIPASHVGAHHRRDRIWIIAYAAGDRWNEGKQDAAVANTNDGQCIGPDKEVCAGWDAVIAGCEDVANAASLGRQGPWEPIKPFHTKAIINRKTINAFSGRIGNQWIVEPGMGRVAHGVPNRAHRLRGLGNAVVPQIAEMIGNAILAADQGQDQLPA